MRVRVVGSNSSYKRTRCFHLGSLWNQTLRQLESSGQFNHFAQLRDAVGPGDVLYVQQAHLPPDFVQPMQGITSFRRFCQVIAFTHIIHQKSWNVYASPVTMEDEANSTFLTSSGFAVPQAQDPVEPANLVSCSLDELVGFLGPQLVHAGKLIVLRLFAEDGIPLGPFQMRSTVEQLVAVLRQNQTLLN